MIHIKKQPTPAKILHSVQKMKASDRWQSIVEGDTTYTQAIRSCFDELEYYDEVQHKNVYAKGLIRAELLKEQHYLCAYCMRQIKDDGATTKVEHYLPLSEYKYKDTALDYQNFFAVCKGGEKPKYEWPEDENGERIEPYRCCESVKGDNTELTIDPRDQDMMEHITYTSQGIISFEGLSDYSEDDVKAIRKDINHHLRLNGKVERLPNGEIKYLPNGDIIHLDDTATRLVYGRKSTYRALDDTLQRWRRNGKLTIAVVDKRIDEILSAEKMDEFAGVKLFLLKRERRRLLIQSN